MYCISFINVPFNADESCQMTETTVVYPLKTPGWGNRRASRLHSFARHFWLGHRLLSMEATEIPPPASLPHGSPGLQTGCNVPYCLLDTTCFSSLLLPVWAQR